MFVGIKENNRINAERTKLNKESLENLAHDQVLPEYIIEGLESLESSKNRFWAKRKTLFYVISGYATKKPFGHRTAGRTEYWAKVG